MDRKSLAARFAVACRGGGGGQWFHTVPAVSVGEIVKSFEKGGWNFMKFHEISGAEISIADFSTRILENQTKTISGTKRFKKLFVKTICQNYLTT